MRGVLEVKEKKKNFWQINCGNAIAEIEKKKIWNNCGNGIAEIGWGKKLHLVYGNAIAEIGGKIFFFGNCGNPIAENGKEKKVVFEIWGGIKKNATSTIFLQHFHNKLQVISYY